MRFRLSKPTPAFVVAVTALFVALGGTSYAVTQIGTYGIKDGSILSRDIQDGTIRSADIKTGSVYGVDVADGSLTADDFGPGTLLRGDKGAKGDTGSTGPQGPQGPQGNTGTQGPPGLNGTSARWVLVNANGTIEAQSGGFEILSAYDLVNNTIAPGDTVPGSGTVPGGALGNVYIDANEPLDDNGIVASIALQNLNDQNGDSIMNGRAAGPDVNPEFSGEISATMCAITGVVGCAPPGANNINHFVVSPRMSDGSVTVSPVAAAGGNPAVIGTHKRFYVIITGDSTDFVAPAS
ncbi:MAG: hypothetical protein NTV23_08630 [Propionibacteriales bacterium]|nr:hypothetical protein [Propionibacteriales bacterium]